MKETVLPRIDVEACIEKFDNQMYAMILVAAHRARELQRKTNFTEKNSQRLIRDGYKPVNAALNEIYDGKLTTEGLK